MVLRCSAVTLALLSFNFLVIAQEQPPKTFRSSVDLVPVDVNVVDRTGRPVPDLTAEDFALTVDGKPRRIASAQFITVSRSTDAPEPPTNYSSNAAAPGGRLIMIAIDQANIGAGRGKYAMESARGSSRGFRTPTASGWSRCPAPDRRSTSPPTTRWCRRRSEGRRRGDAGHRHSRVGISEALEIYARQRADHQRSRRPRVRGHAPPKKSTCRRELANDARTVFTTSRSRTIDSMVSLRHLIERMARTTSPKTLVLVSEGLLIEREFADVTWVGPVASRGQVTLYVLQLDTPEFEASNARISPSRSEDIALARKGWACSRGSRAARSSASSATPTTRSTAWRSSCRGTTS